LTDSLESLTSEQRRKLEAARNSWRNIGLSVAQTDKATAEMGLEVAYRAAGFNSPKFVIWLKSPRAGATAARLLQSDLDWPWQLDAQQRAVWDAVWTQCINQIEEHIGQERWHEVRRKIRQEANQKIIDKYNHLIESRIKAEFSEKLGIWVWQYMRQATGNPILDEVRTDVEQKAKAIVTQKISRKVGDEVFEELVLPIRQQVGGAITDPLRLMMTVNNGVLVGRQTWNCGFGQHDSSWVAYYDFLAQVGIKGGEILDGIAKLTQSSGWWWPYENFAILTERPTLLKRDNRGLLHCEDGMCMQYADGWGIYAWHGILVPEYVITLPEPITFELIEAEVNVEVRRVLIERFGLDNYLRAGHAIKVHKDSFGTLYKMNLRGDEPILVVHVVNSTPEPDGTYNQYFLRVPPMMVRAKQAVAWTFGLSEEEYEPLVET